MNYVLLNILKKGLNENPCECEVTVLLLSSQIIDFLNPIKYLWINNKQSNYQKKHNKMKTDKIFKIQKI